MLFVSNWTGARRSRSLISMSRMGMRRSPLKRSSSRRMIFRSRPASLQASINSAAASRPGAGDHQHVGRLAAGGDFADVVQLAQHGDLAQTRVVPASVGAEEAADAVRQFAVRLDLVGQHAVGMVGADQHGPAAVALVEHRPELFPVHPPAPAQRAQQHDGDAAVENQNAAGKLIGPVEEAMMAMNRSIASIEVRTRAIRSAKVTYAHQPSKCPKIRKSPAWRPGSKGGSPRNLHVLHRHGDVESQHECRPIGQGEDGKVTQCHQPESPGQQPLPLLAQGEAQLREQTQGAG